MDFAREFTNLFSEFAMLLAYTWSHMYDINQHEAIMRFSSELILHVHRHITPICGLFSECWHVLPTSDVLISSS